MPKRTDRTPKSQGRPPNSWKPAFIAALRHTPVVRFALLQAGVSRCTAYTHRAKDAAFAADWEEAIQDGVDMLEMEANRRAAHGVDRPIYFQGTRIDTVKDFSDNLLMFLLKAYRPEKFRDNFDLTRLVEAQRGNVPIDPIAKSGAGRNGRH